MLVAPVSAPNGKILSIQFHPRCRDLLLGAIKGDELPEGIDMCRWSERKRVDILAFPLASRILVTNCNCKVNFNYCFSFDIS